MADVTDTNNTSGKLEGERKKLSTADINKIDREAIQLFIQHREHVEERAANTLLNDLGNLRRAAEWAEKPLVEMSMADVRSFFAFLTAPKPDGRGLNPGGSGVFGYKRVLRLFFDWLDDEAGYDSYPFADDIELPSADIDPVDEEDLLDPDEITALKEGAMNPRDKALIEFLADTGPRITLATQLRVRDVHDMDTRRPYYTPNPEGKGHKGVRDEKQIPILDSRAELRTYLNHHHIDPRPEAPLWALDNRWYDPDDPQEGAMSSDRIRDMLKECAERADIDPGRVNPHAFRHVALTRMSNSERLTPQEIQHIAGWADERMLEKYDHTTDAERNEGIYEASGYTGPDADEEQENTPLKRRQCGNCREDLSPYDTYCPNCGVSTDSDVKPGIENLLLDFAQYVGSDNAEAWMRAKLHDDTPEHDNLSDAVDADIAQIRTEGGEQ